MIVITGQTATGKTNLALKLAAEEDGELINFDSRQVYKELDIITGKDVPKNSNFILHGSKSGYDVGYHLLPYADKHKIKLWLYDIVNPDRYFSSYDFSTVAKDLIADIKGRKKLPILVGGSYFYLKHLLYGFDFKSPPNFRLRDKLNEKSVTELQEALKKLDVVSFNKMNHSDRHNPRRLIRRIEILTDTQNPKTTPTQNQKFLSKSNPNIIGLHYKNRDELRSIIKKRVNKRLNQGAIEEVKYLLDSGYKKTDPGMKSIGYKQLMNFLEGSVTKEQAIEEWITAEVQYAKRQYTFMKKDKNITWNLV
ncbi:tRNA (adenosine(37)-N6)-dimethylallyltransferase MiaA [Patescibacteria group bacterium]|nr:tRNA (adenosine(37)-N6)-dimethylallyltransferase MiaA [Patescibacteria group bacterium]